MENAIALYCLVVISVALWAIRAFHRAYKRHNDNLKAAYQVVSSVQSEEEFAEYYYDIDNQLKSNSSMGHVWSEFTETLIEPRHEIDSEIYRNSEDPHNFFNRFKVCHDMSFSFYSALPGNLTGLGILGTFIGLVYGITTSHEGLTADSINRQQAALQNLLDGASLAFWTSIVGLLAAILTSVLIKYWSYRLDSLCSLFCRSLERRLRRVTREAMAYRTLQETQDQRIATQQFGDQLAFQLSDVIQKQMGDPLTSKLDAINEALNELRSDRAGSHEAALERLVNEVSENLSGAAGKEVEALGETLQRIQNGLQEQVDQLAEQSGQSQAALQHALESLQEAISQGVAHIQEAAASLHGTSQSIKGVQNDLGVLVGQSKELVNTAQQNHQALADTVTPIKESADQFASTGEKLNVAGERFGSVGEQISEALSNLKASQEKVQENWDRQEKRFEGIDESLTNTFKELEDGLARYNETVSKFVSNLDEHTANISQHLATITSDISEKVDELAEILGQRSKTDS